MITLYSLFEAQQQNPKEIYDLYYSDMLSWEEFVEIAKLDPTTVIYEDGGLKKVGKYVKWIVGIKDKEDNWEEDKEIIEEYLTIYDRARVSGRIEDKGIFTYKSIPDLFDAVRPFFYGEQYTSRKKEIKTEEDIILDNESEIVYEDDKVIIQVPETYEASCILGKDTAWCTANRNTDSYFKRYTKEGKLFIFKDKETKERWQIHFPSENESRDASNRYVPIAYIFERFPQTIPTFFDFSEEKYNLKFYEMIEFDNSEYDYRLIISQNNSIFIESPFRKNGILEDSDGEERFLLKLIGSEFIPNYLEENNISIKNLIRKDDWENDEELSSHIGSIYSIWGHIKNSEDVAELISNFKELSYDMNSDTFTLTLDSLEGLAILWYEGGDYSVKTIEKVLSDDYLADELIYIEGYYIGDEMENYLEKKEYDLIRNILIKHKDEIEDYEDLDLEDDGELESYIKNSHDDIANSIKNCLIGARVTCEEDAYYIDLRDFVLSKSVNWLTGRKYDIKTDFNYSKSGTGNLVGIKKDLVIGALSVNPGYYTFLYSLSCFITKDDRDEYGGIETDLSSFEYWYGNINKEDFREQFVERLSWDDIMDKESYEKYKAS
jgi:hypothetical protein